MRNAHVVLQYRSLIFDSCSVLDFGPQIKSNPNQIQILPDFDLDFKRFFLHGFGFEIFAKIQIKSKSLYDNLSSQMSQVS